MRFPRDTKRLNLDDVQLNHITRVIEPEQSEIAAWNLSYGVVANRLLIGWMITQFLCNNYCELPKKVAPDKSHPLGVQNTFHNLSYNQKLKITYFSIHTLTQKYSTLYLTQ